MERSSPRGTGNRAGKGAVGVAVSCRNSPVVCLFPLPRSRSTRGRKRVMKGTNPKKAVQRVRDRPCSVAGPKVHRRIVSDVVTNNIATGRAGTSRKYVGEDQARPARHSEVHPHARVDVAHHRTVRALERSVGSCSKRDSVLSSSSERKGSRSPKRKQDSRCTPRQSQQTLFRNAMAAREEHGRVCRRRLFFRNRARED